MKAFFLVFMLLLVACSAPADLATLPEPSSNYLVVSNIEATRRSTSFQVQNTGDQALTYGADWILYRWNGSQWRRYDSPGDTIAIAYNLDPGHSTSFRISHRRLRRGTYALVIPGRFGFETFGSEEANAVAIFEI